MLPSVAAGIFMAAMAIIVSDCRNAAPTAAPSLPEVTVTDVVQRDVTLHGEWVGTTEGFINADIYPKISGFLIKQDYRDGDAVQAGQLLFQIDPREYQAALDQALGNLAQAQAQLKQNQQILARYTILYKQEVISQQDFDNQTQTTRATAAQVQANQGLVEAARLNLEWTRITSPVSGVAGIAKTQVGDLVSPTSLLTTVSQLNPIKVEFPISEQTYLHFASKINQNETDLSKDGPPLEMILSNGSIYKYTGRVYDVNRQVNIQTGTIEVQATFPNPDNLLRPGLYAKIRGPIGALRNALMVPQAAVLETQGQYQIGVVGSDNKVQMRNVALGQQVGSLQVIKKGIAPGERVITEGLQKVHDGMEVKPRLLPVTAAPASTRGSAGVAPSAATTPGSQS
ncbi:MAG TPA: efflux RND transporter periplasmic adaptor subunit [Candidatus Binataceae bacterium]|nr:efflux RND transporter periplasmic adaptor subunit [Candidatus Binataceae bacterium]